MASIKVCVRMRPFLSHDAQEREEQPRIAFSKQSNQVKVDVTGTKEKHFKFNQVFTSQNSQQEVYNGVEAISLVDRVLEGYHSTIFAYGQTGSGKTYTIEGTERDEGLIPRSIRQLFINLSTKNHNERSYKIFLSFIQIYNENIYDLIDLNEKPLKMRWNKHQQFIVEDMFEGQCRDAEEALRWWHRGHKNKIMGSHKMNATSSRSHCILTLKVHSSNIEDPSDSIQSKLQIVDLAGSERQRVTKSTGAIFREGIEINKSLFTLRQVIAALYQASNTANQRQTENKILPPYRDSKLTSLLKQSIGGNSFCVMIACLNPQESHFQESLQTLTYASMASYISNAPTKNIDPKIQQNEQLKEQNYHLKVQLNKMTDHIEYLTKLLENNQCLECKKGEKNVGLSKSQKQQTIQPSGIVSFPKLSATKTDTKDKPKTMKTTKDMLESISMIKDLIAANAILREKIQSLKHYIERQEKETFTLMQENQVLRDRWDMLNGTIVKQNYEIEPKREAPIAAYQRMVRENRGQIELDSGAIAINSHKKMSKIHNRSEGEGMIGNKISYNEFLLSNKSKKKQNTGRRKRLYSQAKKGYYQN